MLIINLFFFLSFLVLYFIIHPILKHFAKFKYKKLFIKHFYKHRYYYFVEWGDYIKSAGASLFIVGFVGFFIPVSGVSIGTLIYVMILGIIIGEGGIRIKIKASKYK